MDVFEEDSIIESKPDSVTTNELERMFNDVKSNFAVYPNPSKGEFTIKYDVLTRGDVKVEIYNIIGDLVKTVVNVNGQYQGQYHIPVNLGDLPNGVYVVTLINNGKRSIEKLILEK